MHCRKDLWKQFHAHVRSARSRARIFKRSSVTLRECACCRLDRFPTQQKQTHCCWHVIANICLKQFASAVSHTCASGVHVHSQEEPVTPLPCSFALAATYPFAGPCHSGHGAMGVSTLVTLFGYSTPFGSTTDPIDLLSDCTVGETWKSHVVLHFRLLRVSNSRSRDWLTPFGLLQTLLVSPGGLEVHIGLCFSLVASG